MRRISSRSTFFYKRVFPAIWVGGLALFMGTSLFAQRSTASSLLPFLIMPAIMMGFGYFVMQRLVFDLVDEVWDDGDTLVVKNRGQEQRIALTDVKNVSYSPWVNPPRVTLLLRRPTIFGHQVVFCAPLRFVPFASNSTIDDLIDRIDAARQK